MNTILKQRIEKAAKRYAWANDTKALPYDTNTRIPIGVEVERAAIYGAAFALQNQWISVEEALPEEHGIYFVLVNSKVPRITTFTDKWNIGDNTYDITHWMSIPRIGGEK